MLTISIVLFALAAVFGLILISYVLRGKETPKGIVFLHGPIAATALILLIIYVLNNTVSPIASMILFIIAALGGVVMVIRDFTGKKIPKGLAVIHGLIAVTAFVLLIVFVLK